MGLQEGTNNPELTEVTFTAKCYNCGFSAQETLSVQTNAPIDSTQAQTRVALQDLHNQQQPKCKGQITLTYNITSAQHNRTVI